MKNIRPILLALSILGLAVAPVLFSVRANEHESKKEEEKKDKTCPACKEKVSHLVSEHCAKCKADAKGVCKGCHEKMEKEHKEHEHEHEKK